MDLRAFFELTADVSCLLAGAAAIVIALRARARASAERIAARAANEREALVLASARRTSDASRRSVRAVRDALCASLQDVAPAIDLLLFYERNDAGILACVDARGARAAFYAGAALETNSAAYGAMLRGHHLVLDASFLHPMDRAAVVIPLDDVPETAALIYVASASEQLFPSASLIAAIADQAAPAYRLAREREADRRRAEFDGLTGLLAPRAFRSRLAQLVERAERDARMRLALVFIDTDRFKAWNDTYGHASGDALLRRIAQTIRVCANGNDEIAARNGGDEFCAVFTETEKSKAIERADALRRAIANLDLAELTPDGAPATVHVTASIGIAAYPYDARTADDLLEAADAAMYRSKHEGRDRVSFYGVDGALRGASLAADPVAESADVG